MKKSGFSMIELVFVIVILGILAGVALPRLSATRDDAAFAVAMQNLDTLVKDMQNFYVSQGRENVTYLPYQNKRTPWGQNMNGWYLPIDLEKMTNVPLKQDSTYPAYFDFEVGGKPCIKIAANVMDLQRAFGNNGHGVDRDVVLLKFDKRPYQNKKLSSACRQVMESELFRKFDAEIERFLGIRLTNERGEVIDNKVYPTGGALLSAASLFADEILWDANQEDMIKFGETGDIIY